MLYYVVKLDSCLLIDMNISQSCYSISLKVGRAWVSRQEPNKRLATGITVGHSPC
jgi:hypothetical protein